jgi:hypothetical protein
LSVRPSKKVCEVSHGSCTGRGGKKCDLGALEGRPRTKRDNVG